MITAIGAVLIFAAVFTAAVVTASWLDRPRPALRWADARLAGWLSPPPGDHHKFAAPDAAPLTPAPDGRPGQEPRPGDPPWVGGAVRAGATTPPPRGAARAGQAQDLAPVPRPAQVAAAYVPAPGDAAASAVPVPPGPPSGMAGPGQHPFSAPVKIAFPDGNVAILDSRGKWRIKPLTWDGRLTGEQPALVPGVYSAFERWQDAAVNVP